MHTEYPEGGGHYVHMAKKDSYRKIQQIEKYRSTILLKGNKVQGVWPDLRLQINGKLRICSPKSPYCFVLFYFVLFCFALFCFVYTSHTWTCRNNNHEAIGSSLRNTHCQRLTSLLEWAYGIIHLWDHPPVFSTNLGSFSYIIQFPDHLFPSLIICSEIH